MNFSLLMICGLMLLSVTGCATVHPAAQKKEIVLISSAEEVQVGRGMAANIVMKKTPPFGDAAKQRFINIVGQRVAQVSDRRDIIYHFMVLDSPDLNAFALPGGYIYVYKGLFDKLNEDELAALLAHEVGHVAVQHAVKKMQSFLGHDLLIGIALAGLDVRDPELERVISGVSGPVYDLLSRGYGRDDELLADKLGVKYLRLAHYDPRALVRVLELLQEEKVPGGRVFETLSDRSRMKERIRKVKEEIEKH